MQHIDIEEEKRKVAISNSEAIIAEASFIIDSDWFVRVNLVKCINNTID